MALIAMAIYDTEENQRFKITEKAVNSLIYSSTTEGHSLWFVVNSKVPETEALLYTHEKLHKHVHVVYLPENIGTAKAINKAWMNRQPGENCIKMDDDVIIYEPDWINMLEEVVTRDPTIGIVGLKRTDCIETPWHENEWYRSELKMLPHERGQRWLIVEKVQHVMGTCQLYSSACLDKIGYLWQMDELYGFDDALASVRAQKAGFQTVHYSPILIDHIDPGGDNPYMKWKAQVSGEAMGRYNATAKAIRLGHLPYYHGPD